MTTNNPEIVAMFKEWEDLDPYGFYDALFDYADNDRDALLQQVAADPDGLRAMLDEIHDEID